jgi:hypothetical protein
LPSTRHPFRLGVNLEVVIEALAAQGAGRPDSLDEPNRDAEGPIGRLRSGSAVGLHEGEFDLIEHRQALAPLLAALPDRERRIVVPRFFDGLTHERSARAGGYFSDARVAHVDADSGLAAPPVDGWPVPTPVIVIDPDPVTLRVALPAAGMSNDSPVPESPPLTGRWFRPLRLTRRCAVLRTAVV